MNNTNYLRYALFAIALFGPIKQAFPMSFGCGGEGGDRERIRFIPSREEVGRREVRIEERREEMRRDREERRIAGLRQADEEEILRERAENPLWLEDLEKQDNKIALMIGDLGLNPLGFIVQEDINLKAQEIERVRQELERLERAEGLLEQLKEGKLL